MGEEKGYDVIADTSFNIKIDYPVDVIEILGIENDKVALNTGSS